MEAWPSISLTILGFTPRPQQQRCRRMAQVVAPQARQPHARKERQFVAMRERQRERRYASACRAALTYATVINIAVR